MDIYTCKTCMHIYAHIHKQVVLAKNWKGVFKKMQTDMIVSCFKIFFRINTCHLSS